MPGPCSKLGPGLPVGQRVGSGALLLHYYFRPIQPLQILGACSLGLKMAIALLSACLPRPPYLRGYQAVASVRRYKQALPCWLSAPSLLLQVSGHDSLTVQSLLTQTGELLNTRWLDRCANPLARPLLQAWAWFPTLSVGNKGSVCSSALPTQGRRG